MTYKRLEDSGDMMVSVAGESRGESGRLEGAPRMGRPRWVTAPAWKARCTYTLRTHLGGVAFLNRNAKSQRRRGDEPTSE